MALRFANKIHSLVNNVVLRSTSAAAGGVRQAQGLKVQPCMKGIFEEVGASKSGPPPKTRYPLNQQDANSYIEQLKIRSFLQNAQNNEKTVRTFNVNVHTRDGTRGAGFNPLPNDRQVGVQRLSQCCQRFMKSTSAGGSKGAKAGKAGKAGKKRKSGKGAAKGDKAKEAADKAKAEKGKFCAPVEKPKKAMCVKMPKPMGCPNFKLDNCKQQHKNSCARRKFYFSDCTKRPAPYPSFSEACYEEPYPSVNECRDCPWGVGKHPTFKPTMKKAPPVMQKKKFHTDARRMVTLRFGEEQSRSERKLREEELQKMKLYDDLNGDLFGPKSGAKNLIVPQITKLSPIPHNADAEMCELLVQMKAASERVTPLNRDHVNMLLMGKKYNHYVKKNPLGDRRRHRMRRKRQDRCLPPCKKFPFVPPEVYDIKKKARQFEAEEKRKKRSTSTCDCKGNVGEGNDVIACAASGSGARAPPDGGCTAMMDGIVGPEMLAKMRKYTHKDGVETDKCDILEPSPVCPKDLLDRKPYPKYRKAMKRRLKNEKKLEKKRRAKRGPPKKGGKTPSTKKADGAVVEEGGLTCAAASCDVGVPSSGVFIHFDGQIEGTQSKPYAIRPHNAYRKQRTANYMVQRRRRAAAAQADKCVAKFDFKPLPDEHTTDKVAFIMETKEREAMLEAQRMEQEQIAEVFEKLEKMIIAKDRIRTTGPAVCPSNDCQTPMKEKKCPKKIRSKVCPEDLLDRKPFPKFRKRIRGKKHHHGKGHHHKHHHHKHGKHGKRGKHGKKHRKHRKHPKHHKKCSEAADPDVNSMMVTAEPPHCSTSRPTL